MLRITVDTNKTQLFYWWLKDHKAKVGNCCLISFEVGNMHVANKRFPRKPKYVIFNIARACLT